MASFVSSVGQHRSQCQQGNDRSLKKMRKYDEVKFLVAAFLLFLT